MAYLFDYQGLKIADICLSIDMSKLNIAINQNS